MVEQEPVVVADAILEEPQTDGKTMSRREFLDKYGKPAAIGAGLLAAGGGSLYGLLRLAAKISKDAAEEEVRRLDAARRVIATAVSNATPTSTATATSAPTRTPAPTATPQPETPTPVPFGPSETGNYNAETLAGWAEIEQQPPIDARIGISVLPSRVVRGQGTVEWHAAVAEKLGFQRVAIVLSPPEHENHTGIETPPGTDLVSLVSGYGYDRFLQSPAFKEIHITCDVGNPAAANGWQFPKSGFTEAQLEATYDEYYALAKYLLFHYGDLNKQIVIGGPNEMELLCKGGYSPGTEDADISPAAIENAVAYYDTMIRAVRAANQNFPGSRPLRTGIEVLQIRKSLTNPDAQNGLTAVVPRLAVPPDEVNLSAWQFAGKGGEPGYMMRQAVELIREHAPHSVPAVTEYGLADKEWGGLTREQVADKYQADLKTTMWTGADAAYTTVWGLTGFNADVNFPDNDQMRGLGLIRPDGSIRREVYNALRAMSNVAPVG